MAAKIQRWRERPQRWGLYTIAADISESDREGWERRSCTRFSHPELDPFRWSDLGVDFTPFRSRAVADDWEPSRSVEYKEVGPGDCEGDSWACVRMPYVHRRPIPPYPEVGTPNHPPRR